MVDNQYKYRKYYKNNSSIITDQDLYYDGFENPYMDENNVNELFDVEEDSENKHDEYLLKLMRGEINRIR